MDSSGDNSYDNAATVRNANGGMRRKHHRPWTLSEVVKLVEGVARYGAGRWSEIKRVSFASYSYRTSVDLKVYILRAIFFINGVLVAIEVILHLYLVGGLTIL